MTPAKTILVVAVLATLSSVALANSLGPITTTTPIPSSLTDWTRSLSFPQFNPSLGTLTGVEIDLAGHMTTTVTVTENDGALSYGNAKTELQMTVQDVGGNLSGTPQIDMIGPEFYYSLNAGGSVTSGLLTKSGSSSDLYTSAPILAEFTGTGSFALRASTFTQTLLANTGGNTNAGQVTNASLTGLVTYYYTTAPPVPEPVTMFGVLLGVGALGRYWSRKHRMA
jgi:hypothetical protein